MTLTTQLPIDRRRGRKLISERTAHLNATRFRCTSILVMRTPSEREESLDDFTAAAHESIIAEVLRFGTIRGEQL